MCIINYTITRAVYLPASGQRYQNQMSLSEFVIAEPVDFQDLKQVPGNESREQPLLLTSLRKKNQNKDIITCISVNNNWEKMNSLEKDVT